MAPSKICRHQALKMKTANLRVHAALAKLNIPCAIQNLDHETRTSAQAAAALGCSQSQIAKSIVFKSRAGRPILAVTSGSNRVRLDRLSEIIGEKIGKADAKFVRASTGFSIGGVAPTGLPDDVETVFDSDLFRHGSVWAAAGTPNSLFSIQRDDLRRLAGNRIYRFAEPLF